MITTIQLSVKKILPFNSNYIEQEFKRHNLDVLRWAVTKVTEDEFILDVAIIK